ncbi:MAG TPA: hypothetical protein VM537_17810 [Anaerolineae bacterium]|nr:hypothetical protein [Anaerolineae bacterium]
MQQGLVSMSGRLSARVIRAPRAPLSWRLRNTLRSSFILGLLANSTSKLFSKVTGLPVVTGTLHARKINADGSVVDYGLLSERLVTTAFVNFMVDQLVGETSEFGDFKFHDCGTGVVAEDVSDTAMGTQYGGARATGTQLEGASANIYRSVGTISFTGALAITEHGLFSIVTAGTLMDRSVFAAINVADGDSIAFTYELTCTAGG